jgi:hypothetical protein
MNVVTVEKGSNIVRISDCARCAASLADVANPVAFTWAASERATAHYFLCGVCAEIRENLLFPEVFGDGLHWKICGLLKQEFRRRAEPLYLSLSTICRAMLDAKHLWPADGRAEGLRQDIEQLLGNIEALDSSGVLGRYIWALLHIRSRLPELHVNRGDLAGLVSTLPTVDPTLNDEEVKALWNSMGGGLKGN